MQPISFYLNTLSRIEPKDWMIRRAAREAIALVTGMVVADAAIAVSGRVVYITAHPLLKTELYMRREEVTRALDNLLVGRRESIIR